METLIGLLLLLLPAIFKVVEKKLNASGKAGGKAVAPVVAADEEDADEPEEIASGPFGFPAGTLKPEVDLQHDMAWPYDLAQQREAVLKNDRPMQPAPQAPQAHPAHPVRKPVQKKPAGKTASDAKSCKEKKIDPRKLVVYSEIMKPKFSE